MLDERTRRLMAASEALVLPYGGVSRVHRACGLSRNAIAKGIREIQSGTALEAGRVRRRGAGRKPLTVHDPDLVIALDRLVEPDTLGDPGSPLRWVCKSTRVLAAELGRQRHPISHRSAERRVGKRVDVGGRRIIRRTIESATSELSGGEHAKQASNIRYTR